MSLKALQIIRNRIQHMHDRIAKSKGCFYRQRRWKFLIMVATVTLYLNATVVFAYHAYLTISRYMKYEFQQSSITTQNQSLFMPIVLVKLDTYRNNNSEVIKPPIEMKFDASLDNERLSSWFFEEHHNINQHYISANVINEKFLGENFTLENAKFIVF